MSKWWFRVLNFPKFLPIASEVAYRNQRDYFEGMVMCCFSVSWIYISKSGTIFYQNLCFEDKLSNVKCDFWGNSAWKPLLSISVSPCCVKPWLCEEQGKEPECHLSLGIHQPLLWRTISFICYWEKRTLNDNSNALRWFSHFAGAFCPQLPLKEASLASLKVLYRTCHNNTVRFCRYMAMGITSWEQ